MMPISSALVRACARNELIAAIIHGKKWASPPVMMISWLNQKLLVLNSGSGILLTDMDVGNAGCCRSIHLLTDMDVGKAVCCRSSHLPPLCEQKGVTNGNPAGRLLPLARRLRRRGTSMYPGRRSEN